MALIEVGRVSDAFAKDAPRHLVIMEEEVVQDSVIIRPTRARISIEIAHQPITAISLDYIGVDVLIANLEGVKRRMRGE